MAAWRQSQTDEIFAIGRAGDLQNLQDFYTEYPETDINLRNEDQETLLIYCAKRLKKKWKLPFGGHFAEICKLLIERDIDVDLRDSFGNSAVYYAVEGRALEIVKLLVRNNARLDIAGKDNDSALDLIAQRGELDWIRVICKLSSERSQVCSQQNIRTALFHRLLATKHDSCIWWMCEQYPEVIEEKDEEMLSALNIAIINHNFDALTTLVEFNANKEAVDDENHTVLHYSVVHGYADCLIFLLTNGAEVNCQDCDGASPLHYAVSTNLDQINNDYENQLQCDITIECLLSYGASVTLSDNNGRVPLHWAANADNANACKLMVSKGCPINTPSNDGLTALHIAASRGYTECMRVLVVSCGADVNVTDKNGHTPLWYALSMENIDCAELLLCGGALPNTSNTQGSNPAHYAASRGLTSALEILHKYEASLEVEDTDGNRPLHKAVLDNQLDTIDYLLKCKSNVNVRNKEGLTPLHLAASLGSIRLCECLLAAGATVNSIVVKSEKKFLQILTALDFAHSNNHVECEYFLKNVNGTYGETIANNAATKIQKYWKRRQIVQSSLEESTKTPNDNKLDNRLVRDEKEEQNRENVAESDESKSVNDGYSDNTTESPTTNLVKQEKDLRTVQLPQINTMDIVTIPKGETVGPKRQEKKKMQSKEQTCNSTENKFRQVTEELNTALEVEITRTEKLSKEIERIKESLTTRGSNLEQQLKEIEIKLRQT